MDLQTLFYGSLDKANLYWGYLAGKLGAKSVLDHPFLIGIRKLPIIHAPKYDDHFVLLTKDDPFVLFPGATHAYQLDSKLAVDINNDGRPDVASIKPGKYILTDALSAPYPIFILTMPDGNGNIPAWRDVNHDGTLSGDELNQQNVFATAVLLHGGYSMPADSIHRSSIACQTTDLKYLNIIHNAAQKMKTKVIDYNLITEDDANNYLKDISF